MDDIKSFVTKAYSFDGQNLIVLKIAGVFRQARWASVTYDLDMEERMSNKKPRYSLEQHDKLALELQTMRDRLTTIVVELSTAYPLNVYKYASKALEAVDTLRSKMDDEVCKEQFHNKEIKATDIYYRAGRKDYVRKPKPIYPLREIKGSR